jgi:hypothetical protein
VCEDDDLRLFDLDEIPEVPLIRQPHRSRGETDARFRNDYPPEWYDCPTSVAVYEQQPDPFVRGKTISVYTGERTTCPVCWGAGSLKARARLEAGHRCERCKHPFIPRSDAKRFGLLASPGQWSPCDRDCTHEGPVRYREAAFEDGGRWSYVDLTGHGQTAGEGMMDEGMFGPTQRYEVEAEWRVLTVHHLDGDKANCRWWNLAALCQRCHLEIQAKVVMERVYPHEHSEWFKPHAAAYYAWVYRGRELSRADTLAHLEELLALELDPAITP